MGPKLNFGLSIRHRAARNAIKKARFESFVHIESMELTDADFGIVDADPPNKPHKQLGSGDSEVKP